MAQVHALLQDDSVITEQTSFLDYFPPSCCSTQQLTSVISYLEAQEEQLFQEGKGRLGFLLFGFLPLSTTTEGSRIQQQHCSHNKSQGRARAD